MCSLQPIPWGGDGVTQPISLIHKFLPCFSMIKYYIDIWQVALYLSLICIDQGMLNDMINFNTDLFFCYPDRTFLSESPKSWSRFYEEIISSRGGPLRCISAIDVMGPGELRITGLEHISGGSQVRERQTNLSSVNHHWLWHLIFVYFSKKIWPRFDQIFLEK